MGHDHDHQHGDRNAFYMEQLFTIGVCGAFAGVTLILWYSGALNKMLAEKFHIWVLLGGATLLLMAVVNAVAVWFSVGEAKAVPFNGDDHDHAHDDAHHHQHDHAHGHDHTHGDHDHAHEHDNGHGHSHTHDHSHSKAGVQTTAPTSAGAATGLKQEAPAVAAPAPAHDHSHDGHNHGWAPWRYAVLLLPVAIYFVVPMEALSSAGSAGITVDDSGVSASAGAEKEKNVDESITFQQLELAALYDANRAYYQGKMVRLVGQCVPQDARHFTLRRIKINCCAADGVPLNAVIIIDPSSKDTLDMNRLQGKWIQVTGRVEFLKRTGGIAGNESYATTLILTPTEDRPLFNPNADPSDNKALVKEVAPPANPYLN